MRPDRVVVAPAALDDDLARPMFGCPFAPSSGQWRLLRGIARVRQLFSRDRCFLDVVDFDQRLHRAADDGVWNRQLAAERLQLLYEVVVGSRGRGLIELCSAFEDADGLVAVG